MPTPKPFIPLPSRPVSRRTQAPPPDDETARALEVALERLLQEHHLLLALAGEQRAAIARADHAALARSTDAQAEVAQRIAGLEHERQTITARLAPQPAPGAGSQPDSLRSISARFPAAARERIDAVASRLRTVLSAVHREHAAIRAAAETLGTHMDGLVRQISRSFSHAGTYDRAAVVSAGVQVVSSLDLRS